MDDAHLLIDLGKRCRDGNAIERDRLTRVSCEYQGLRGECKQFVQAVIECRGSRFGFTLGAERSGRPTPVGKRVSPVKSTWYALLTVYPTQSRVDRELLPVIYDYERLAYDMRQEKLPKEFVETIVTGWWTTCLEILPAKGRARGRF